MCAIYWYSQGSFVKDKGLTMKTIDLLREIGELDKAERIVDVLLIVERICSGFPVLADVGTGIKKRHLEGASAPTTNYLGEISRIAHENEIVDVAEVCAIAENCIEELRSLKKKSPAEQALKIIDGARKHGDCLIYPDASKRLTLRGKTVSVARFLYETLVGELESGVTLRRACGDNFCVNTDHFKQQKTKRRKYVKRTYQSASRPASIENAALSMRWTTPTGG